MFKDDPLRKDIYIGEIAEATSALLIGPVYDHHSMALWAYITDTSGVRTQVFIAYITVGGFQVLNKNGLILNHFSITKETC